MAPSKLQEFVQKLRTAFDGATATGEQAVPTDERRDSAACAVGCRTSAAKRRCWRKARFIRVWNWGAVRVDLIIARAISIQCR